MNTLAPDMHPDHESDESRQPEAIDTDQETLDRLNEKYDGPVEPADILYHGLNQLNSEAGRARVDQTLQVLQGHLEGEIDVHGISAEDSEAISDYLQYLTASGVHPDDMAPHLMLQRVLIERIDHPDLPSITDSIND